MIGAAGALIKDIIEDGCIIMPKFTDGKLFLGFFGGVLIGGVSGYLVNGTLITAFLAGYTGKSVIENVIIKAETAKPGKDQGIKEIIKMVCEEEKVDKNLAIKVAQCESNLNPKARNVNSDGSIDRGLFQINSKHHPDVTDEQADDPVFATRFFARAFKAGKISWWNATKSCWDK